MLQNRYRGISVLDGTMCYGQYRKESHYGVVSHKLYGYESDYKKWCEVKEGTIGISTMISLAGVEIFHGDILEDYNGNLHVVGWSDLLLTFVTRRYDSESDLYYGTFKRVVGNIYEDKDMVKWYDNENC